MFLFVRSVDDMIGAVTSHSIEPEPGYYVVEYEGADAEPGRYWDPANDQLEPVELTAEERAAAIADEADRRVDEIAGPRLRERLMARGLEITEKTASGQHLTEKEKENRDTIKAIWARIDAIRDAEDVAILTDSEPVWP